ncbi:hypothetical protein GWI33_023122 [Rhynchophorus ferrugineus]|uniref:Uncharacterized protein n=1 Tax=Rhynchophorus ferrugineus TaxID=354439 RepID=A0A834IRM8_RHYFE|nr:hypothetical protein GWI33_023122 [Rhynchophorus ferrugineus]
MNKAMNSRIESNSSPDGPQRPPDRPLLAASEILIFRTTHPPDFLLWGSLISKVYVNKPQTFQHFKDNIRHEIEEIHPQMLQDVMKNGLKIAESCIANRGHHLTNIIFHS